MREPGTEEAAIAAESLASAERHVRLPSGTLLAGIAIPSHSETSKPGMPSSARDFETGGILI